jgi:hypothetical protein
MLKIIDNEKEYSRGLGDCLMVQDLKDHEDMVQVSYKDFSQFELMVFTFLTNHLEA